MKKHKKSKKKIVLIILAIICVLLAFVIISYFTTVHAAENVVYDYFNMTSDGIAISAFADELGDKVEGLVLLGAHGTNDLTDTNIKTLVLYGSEDGVVQRKKVESGRSILAKPDNYYEVEIPGANHANWANYGTQAMDKEVLISRDEQFRIGIDEITKIFN